MGQFISEMLSDVVGWISGIVGLAIFLGFLYVIGLTGKLVREGIETKKTLKLAKEQAMSKGLSINQSKYQELDSRATRIIFIPLAGWILLYSILFFVLPTERFLASLLFLIAPALGYFGLYIAPDIGLD